MNNIRKIRKISRLFLFFGDMTYTPLVYFLVFWIRSRSTLLFFQERMPLDRMQLVNHRLWILLFMHLLFLYLHGFYDTLTLKRRFEIFVKIVRVVTLEILILVSVYFFSQDILYPRSIFILLWVLLILVSSAWHIFLRRLFRSQLPERSVLIVGSIESVNKIITEIQRLPSYGLKVAGVLLDQKQSNSRSDVLGFPVLGTRDEIINIIESWNIDEVILSHQGSWQESLVDEISKIEQLCTRICVLPNCYEILIGKINHLRLYDIPLIEMIKHPEVPVSKKFFDIVFASVSLVLLFPLLFLSSFLILILMGSPVLYKQTRVGKDRNVFTIFKLRTMIKNAEVETGPVLTDEKDSRVTPLGRWLRKYRVDEIPQLLNILKGEMSFVGPRPERPHFVNQYIDQVPGYGERFKALPGLTGLAQVNGGYATNPENKLKYDLAYIHNHTLWLDVKIIIETIKVILTGRVNPQI
jgi:exopolysaccharide biosynthesis polyprenyl glycosylphosphotransferase